MFISMIAIHLECFLLVRNDKEEQFNKHYDYADKWTEDKKKIKQITLGSCCHYTNQLILL